MKLKAFILTAVLLSSGFNFAQECYVRLHAGYGIGVSSQTDYDYFSTETAPNVSNYSYKTKDYSFGKGMYFGASFGYFLNDNIALDLELQYLDGSSYSLNRDITTINSGKSIYDYKNYGTAFMINPSVLLRTKLSVFKPYLKLGPVISFGSINSSVSGYNIATNNARANFSSEMKYSGGVMFGLNAAIGASYEVYRNIDLFFEMNSKNISYAPKEGEMTKYQINGVDYLPRLATSSKKVNFVEDVESTDSQNPNAPAQQRKEYYPFSSFTFSLGVAFTL
ncbi:MAG TPA: hypothetical protein VHO43_15115 [Ignavibacteriales bacterium]|nr:hypothetical protein [Ignavibacteriales bacterium]